MVIHTIILKKFYYLLLWVLFSGIDVTLVVVGALSSPLLFPPLHAFTIDDGQKICKIDKKINNITKLSMKF